MVKFLKITAAIVLLLLIFFVGILKYRTYCAEQTLIPKRATSLIRINVDALYQTLAANMLSNPGYYFKSDFEKDSPGKVDKLATGLSVPASIYLYNLSEKASGTIFSRLEIKNINDFENFINHILHLQVIKTPEGLNIAKSQLGNFVICYNSKAAAFAFATKIEKLDQPLLDILNLKDVVKVKDSPFNELLALKQHVVFSNKDNEGWVDFKNGQIDFSNVFLTESILTPLKPLHHKLNPGSTVNFWLNANLKPGLNKSYTFKNFNLEQDSLIKYYNGNIDFEWTNSITQTDSIITYAYNDDFEKVEKVSLQKRNIPAISVNIDSKVNGLKNYLARQGLINLDSSTVNKNIFPLYKVFVNSGTENLNFTTVKNQNINTAKVPSTDFLYLSIDFIKLSKQLEMPLITNYLKAAERLEVKGKLADGQKIRIDGKFEMKNEDINALYQLLKSF